MNEDDVLEAYFQICKRAYEKHLRDGTWPWTDSPNAEDMVDSEDNPHNV